MRIGFWPTQREKFYTSHQSGLNKEQIEELHALKVGDRLALWMNEMDGNGPKLSLKKLEENKPEA